MLSASAYQHACFRSRLAKTRTLSASLSFRRCRRARIACFCLQVPLQAVGDTVAWHGARWTEHPLQELLSSLPFWEIAAAAARFCRRFLLRVRPELPVDQAARVAPALLQGGGPSGQLSALDDMHSIPVPKPVCRRFNFHSCSASSHLLHAALRPPLVEQLCAQSRSTLLQLMQTIGTPVPGSASASHMICRPTSCTSDKLRPAFAA